MKKVNKILMIVTSILLSLVLISTCIVSGTLAKFVITKDSTTVVALKRFGVTMNVRYKDSETNTVTIDSGVNSVTLTCAPVTVYPGFDEKNTVYFTFDGELNVPAILKITVDVKLNDGFYIADGDIPLLSTLNQTTYPANRAYVPVYFRVGTVSGINADTINGTSTLVGNFKPDDSTVVTVGDFENYLERNFYTYIKSTCGMDINKQQGVSLDVFKEFSQGDPILLGKSNATQGSSAVLGPGFGIGIQWPLGNASTTNANLAQNMIETLIAERMANVEKPITLTITVSLEQKIETT